MPRDHRLLRLTTLAALLCVACAAQATFNEYPIPTANSAPLAIAAGPDGNLWFIEKLANQIGRITPAGVITEFSVPTAASALFGITAGPDGNLWFTEYLGNKIGRITPAGIVTEFSANSPYGITAGPDGNLWFIDLNANEIGRITTTGVITEFSIPTSGSVPVNITAGPDGNIWFTEKVANKIGRITPAGVITEFSVPTADSFVNGITAAPDGNVWFIEESGNKIGRITPTGAITEFLIPLNGTAALLGITAGPYGDVWLIEEGGNKIGKVTTDGMPTAEFLIPTLNSGSFAITAGPDGNLWFTEVSGNKIGKLTPTSLEITLPANVAIAPGQSVPFPVSLKSPALAGGVIFTLTSSDTSKLTVTPSNVLITEGSTTPRATPSVNGIDFGSATITASAFGLTGSRSVQVTATLTFYPGNMTIAGNSRQFLSLLLSAPAPSGGLTINLTSSNTGVATVPATATFAAGATNMTVPVTGVAGGLATITASGLPNLIPATATVIVALANGPASITPTSGTPQIATIDTLFAAPFVVTIIDTNNNPVPGVIVTFTAPSTGPSGSFAGGVNTAMTNAAGVATSAVFTANSLIGSYNVVAAVPSLATTASFALTNAPIITEYLVTFDGGPNEITVGPDGDLWFTEFNGDKIGRISPALTEFPLPSGSGPGGITVGPDGNLWFTESFRNKIGRMTTTGVITEFSLPTAAYASYPSYMPIIVGPDGNLWFTESYGNKIGRINIAGTITEFSVPTANSSPFGITVGPDANIWFTESFANKIGRITPAGVITEFSAFSGNFYPYGITGGLDGNLWFTGWYGGHTSVGTKIARITTTGAITEFSVPSGDTPYWIAAGSDGNLWFTEYAGNRIGRVTVAGAISEFPLPSSASAPFGSTTGPFGITTGRDGNLWFTEYWGGKIGKVDLHAAGMMLPANLTVAPGQSVPFPVKLATAAPAGGVILMLTSSDTSKLTVAPANILIQAGATAPPTPPRVNGISFGSATISASALGFPTVSQQVQVTMTLSFSPPSVPITGNGRQFVALLLSAPAPDGGLTINLSSDNPGVASVPTTETFAAGATTVTIPVTGVAAGSANITASAPGVGAGTASVTVTK